MIAIMTLLKNQKPLDEAVVASRIGAAKAGATSRLPGQRVFNIVKDRSQKGISYARGGVELDAISQFAFPDVSESMAAVATGGLDLTVGLDERELEAAHVVTTLQNTVIEPPPSGALKRMSLLRKRNDVSSEFFQREWFNLHAVLVKRLPGVVGYRQNLVIDIGANKDVLPVDGIVELWFADAAAIENAFRSDTANTLMMHAKEFIAEITTFLVEPLEFGHSA